MDDISQETIRQAAGGDLDAFETIYKMYFGFVTNVAFRVVNNFQDAQDVVQEVFLNVHRKLPGFRLEASLKTWIYRITVNCAINYAKKRAGQRRGVEYDDDLNAAAPEVDARIDKEHHEKLIARLLDALDPDQRACIVLRSIEGLSYQDIADALEIPINTVRSRIKRAREAMLALRKEVVSDEL